MTTRAQLRADIASYIHDAGGTPDLWIDISLMKTAEMLESRYNQVDQVESLTVGQFPIPDNAVSLRELTYNGRVLRSVGKNTMEFYGDTGQPQVYTSRGSNLEIAPFVEGDYTLSYWEKFPLGTEDTATNRVMQNLYHIVLAGALVEGYDWKQDERQYAWYENKWRGLIQDANTNARNLNMGDVPAMRAS